MTNDDFSDTYGDFYVERETRLIYEVKFFEDFVLVRPAAPAFYLALRKMSHNDFARDFDEYNGDHSEIRAALEGIDSELVVDATVN